ncbi:MAG TPA: M3 family oligoendopeptidase [Actinomycetota bacterium]|nr:M3 family oligoendopeptidase [Actinomycetota bacterium]
MAKTALPHWDMNPYFPGLDSEEFTLAYKALVERIAELGELFDSNAIRKTESLEVNETNVALLEKAIEFLNDLSEELKLVRAYIVSFVSQNSRDDVAQAKYSQLQMESVALSKLSTRFTAWVAAFDVDSLVEKSRIAKDHEFMLRRSVVSASHQMSEIEEDLYSDLVVTGARAWERLHNNVSSRLLVEVPGKGKLPMAAVRGLSQDPDSEVRRNAYDSELKAWASVEVPMAAALNSIKGEANVVNARRGWNDSVEASLFNNNIDRQTLEAMQQAVVDSFPDFRRYLGAKARFLGSKSLAWWDLFAPVSRKSEPKIWSWDETIEFTTSRFGAFSPRLADMARRSFDDGWIDAEPREGKADGAFCMGVRKDESRVMLNFVQSFKSVQTLAHELGHAYHNVNLSDRRALQRSTPSALAETASIFCESIIFHAGLEAASDAEKISILENYLQNTCQVVVDIHSRFILEKGVHEGREQRELSVDELKDLMIDAQRQTYGDGLDQDALHPYMWAVKPHYYIASYYNWPYTFGLLFGTGLYAQYLEDPEKFRAGYDDLLSCTGMEDAAALTARFGFDIRDTGFWRSSLDIIKGRIDEFVALV